MNEDNVPERGKCSICGDPAPIGACCGGYSCTKSERELARVHSPTGKVSEPVSADSQLGHAQNSAAFCLVCNEHPCKLIAVSASVALDAGMDTDWPLRDVLIQLAEWAKHLGSVHNCDCHGWEAQSFLIEAATNYAAASLAAKQNETQIDPREEEERRTDAWLDDPLHGVTKC